MYLTNISESSQSRIVHMAQPEKVKSEDKNINKDKQKVEKFKKEIGNKGLFIIPAMRLIFHGKHTSKENLFYWTKWLTEFPDFLQIDRLCCLSEDDGKSRCRVFLVEIVHVRKS
jgi:hypothetical protein